MKAEKTANWALFALGFAAVGFVTGCGEENADRRPVRGELSVYVADNFDGSSKMAFLLRDVSGVEIPLLVEREVDLIPGTEVDVWGERTSKGGTFQHYLWYLGSQTSACGWSGLASVGTPSSPQRNSWYNASTSCVVLAQELSHNFGLLLRRAANAA